MNEQEKDWLDNYEGSHTVFVHRAVYLLGLDIDNITKPIQYSKDYSPPNEELTDKCHFLISVIELL
jgi:hypothetical protein